MTLADVNMRDPFVLVNDGKYYIYYSDFPTIVVRTSTDLVDWSEPKVIFEKNPGFWGTKHYWAPECHYYKGKFYLFASFKSDTHHRATHILVCDTPDGTFVPVSAEPQTPSDWECLDGTLYIEDGKPYMIFSHEWTQITDGTMCYIQLSDDLTHAVSEPHFMFAASEAPFAGKRDSYVTDAPYIYRSKDGRLHLLWATFGPGGYTETSAVSSNGRIDGKWTQEEPIYTADGGHAMVFRRFDGQLMLTLHAPNSGNERAKFIPLTETETGIEIADKTI